MCLSLLRSTSRLGVFCSHGSHCICGREGGGGFLCGYFLSFCMLSAPSLLALLSELGTQMSKYHNKKRSSWPWAS